MKAAGIEPAAWNFWPVATASSMPVSWDSVAVAESEVRLTLPNPGRLTP
jgi:hypothetical protein